jgi:hypothetical protein
MIDIDKIARIQKRTKKRFLRQQKKYIKIINKAIKYNTKHGKSYIEVSLSEPFIIVNPNFINKIIKLYEGLGFKVEKYNKGYSGEYLLIKWKKMEDF